MIRTQVYLTEEEKKGLESAAVAQRKSQSELIREAIDELLERTDGQRKASVLDVAKGLWGDREDITELRDLRRGWNRRTDQ